VVICDRQVIETARRSLDESLLDAAGERVKVFGAGVEIIWTAVGVMGIARVYVKVSCEPLPAWAICSGINPDGAAVGDVSP
jgi:hypothetical protein